MSEKKPNMINDEALEEVSGGTAMTSKTVFRRGKNDKAVAGHAGYVRAKGEKPVATDLGLATGKAGKGSKGGSDPFTTSMC